MDLFMSFQKTKVGQRNKSGSQTLQLHVISIVNVEFHSYFFNLLTLASVVSAFPFLSGTTHPFNHPFIIIHLSAVVLCQQ